MLDAWQEEMAELDKMVEKSGSGRAFHPLCQTGHVLCLPTTAACGGSLGMGCTGPRFVSDHDGPPIFTPFPEASSRPFIDVQSMPVLPPHEASERPFVDDQCMPVLSPSLEDVSAVASAASGGGATAVHRTSSASGASSASLSSMPSMPGEMPGEAEAQDVPCSPAERGVVSDRHALTDFPCREGTNCGREGTHESGHFFTNWRGRCGFVCRLRPETPEGPWMCHHFTVDGVHCVKAGLGPEHANSCAGVCRMIEAETFEDFADPPRCMGLRKPLDGPGYPTLIRCGLAGSSGPGCSPMNCPFLARGRSCPFVKRAAQSRRAEEHCTSTRFSPEPPSASLTRHGGGTLRGDGNGILIEPDPDDDLPPFFDL